MKYTVLGHSRCGTGYMSKLFKSYDFGKGNEI